MCGIVGYVGSATPSTRPLDVALEGLGRLEYRGYDSAGVALVAPGRDEVAVAKKAGKLVNLRTALVESPLPQATAAIGHTRWATHGAPSDLNAHPHVALDGRLAVIHNGIIENFFRCALSCWRQVFSSSLKLIRRWLRICLRHSMSGAGT